MLYDMKRERIFPVQEGTIEGKHFVPHTFTEAKARGKCVTFFPSIASSPVALSSPENIFASHFLTYYVLERNVINVMNLKFSEAL